MRNTKRDVVLHFVIGLVIAACAVLQFLFKFNFKDFAHFMTFGPHFAVLGLVFAIVAGVVLVLGCCGVYVLSTEKKNDAR